MDFGHAETMALIAAYRKRPVVYDAEAVGYNCRKTKATAWKDIAKEVGMRPEACKAKMQSLLAYCRREKTRVMAGNSPKWRYWNAFKFLRGVDDGEDDPLGAAPEVTTNPRADCPWSISRMLAHKYMEVSYPVSPVEKPDDVNENRGEKIVNDDEWSIFGTTAEAKLNDLTKSQRDFAENLIRDTLYQGLVFRLTVDSEVGNEDESDGRPGSSDKT